MKKLVVLFAVLLLSGCSGNITLEQLEYPSEVREYTVQEPQTWGTSEPSKAETVYFSDSLFNQFRESTYMQVRLVTDDTESVLIVDIPNHEVILDGIKHNYLMNKTFSLVGNDWVEVSDIVEIPDWELLNFENVLTPWLTLTEGYHISVGTKGEKIEDYEYYTFKAPVASDEVRGVQYERLLDAEVIYVFCNKSLVSLAIDVGYVISGNEYHSYKSIRLEELR